MVDRAEPKRVRSSAGAQAAQRRGNAGLAFQAGVLSASAAVAAVPIFCAAVVWEGMFGLGCALIACAACLSGGLLGLALARAIGLTGFNSGASINPAAVPGAAIASAIGRLLVPLAVIIVAGIWFIPLRHSGMPYYFLGFYLVGLATETWLLMVAAREDRQLGAEGQLVNAETGRS